ncbi:MAG TPA: hypothetical protein VKE96_29235 [Vicinamibacterales bacterium]|nr:hypothetical protein [Vicinamibacterales bacterium]
MIRLLLPVAGVAVFFALSWATVFVFQPRDPKRFFLGYALLLLLATALTYRALWPLDRIEDALGLACDLLLQLLACLTMWNAFYSVLWGFSGSLIYDLFNEPGLCHRDRLIRSYEGDGDLDRILARRLPNLVRGGWVDRHDRTLRLRPKGVVMAVGTLASFKVFSLGMGGGVK